MIRIANINDLDTINILGNKLHNNFVNSFHMETEINNSDAIVLVCDLDGIVVGYLYALKTIDNIDLLSIIVDESYRRQKIASNLVNYLIDNYCYQDKTITLEVSSNNKEAICFYEYMGFKTVNIRKNYYHDSDAYLMKWGIK